ncbi:Natterin-3 [Folsomia candida]|uniref:Natterin-3 n=1 Tax=Folsomia candida TaxID=158441 RepID=A0A226CZH2_FOLCA|nr:Natterin-3 [Folsomia candida]
MSRVMQAEPRGLQWVAMSRGSFPKFAVEAGIDSGKKLYVARASHAGGVVPGKLHVGHSSAYIAYDGKEISMPNYEASIDVSRTGDSHISVPAGPLVRVSRTGKISVSLVNRAVTQLDSNGDESSSSRKTDDYAGRGALGDLTNVAEMTDTSANGSFQ